LKFAVILEIAKVVHSVRILAGWSR